MDRFSEGLIKPNLILLLKNILNSYPDSGQILKELIQNAEDAGATEVKFLLDEGSNPSQNLYSPELEKFQGPALYAFNNSEFSDEDWRGICLLQDSIKKDNSSTIGRFGVGFKSVFHVTDFPGILSGYGVGFIDPYERYFFNPRTGDISSCKLWNFKFPEVRDQMQAIWDQFQPFCLEMFHAGDLRLQLQNGYRNKTLFRFPLRREQNDESNKLSDNPYSTEKVKKLFQSLETEAREILIFLSKLQRVEAHVKDANGAVSLFFSVCKSMDNIPIPRGISDLEHNSILFNLVFIRSQHSNNSITKTKFLILFYDSPLLDLEGIAIVSSKLSVARRVGLAINLADVKNLNTKLSLAERSTGGQLFCFLPLPKRTENATGFAFHIHSCFIVDQNRSKIKMPASHGNVGEELMWNSYLINSAIPSAMILFCKIISSLELGITDQNARINIKDKLNLTYTIMPHPECVQPEWKPTMQKFYDIVFNPSYRLWLCMTGNTQHTEINADTYFALWLEENTDVTIHEVLRIVGKKIIYVSENVLLALRSRSKQMKSREITSDSVSLVLKRYTNRLTQLESNTKTAILSFLLADVQISGNILLALNRLEGLELIPLENGSWTILQQALVNSPPIFISSSEHSIELLPGLEHSFIKEDIALDLKKALGMIANTELTQLKNMNQYVFMELLQYVRGLEPSNDAVLYYTEAPFNDKYLSKLWNYFKVHRIDLRTIETRYLHIIPKNLDMTEMALFSSRLPLLIADESVDQRVIQCCQEMGIIVLEHIPGYIRDGTDIVGQFVFLFNAPGIIECIRRANLQQVILQLMSISDDLKRAFRRFLEAQLIRFPILPLPEVQVLSCLPMFEKVNGSGFASTHFVSAADANFVGVYNFQSRIPLPTKLIQIMDTETMKLAKSIGIVVQGPIDILTNIVLPRLADSKQNSKDIEQTMVIIFQDFKNILDDDDFIMKHLYNLPFVPTSSGKLMRACDLFDSNDPVLVMLFKEGDKFPSGELASDEFKPILIRLGLRSLSNMTVVDIVAAAELVSKNPNDEKCTTMMRFVENNGESIFKNGQHMYQKKNLQKHAWVVTDTIRPEKYPLALEFPSGYSAPSQVRSRHYCQLIGSIHPTIDTEKWPVSADLFGWCAPPTNEDIISHLYKIIKCYDSTAEKSSLAYNIHDMIQHIYEILNQRAQQQLLTSNCRTKLQETRSLFIEGKFIFPKMCAQNYDRGTQCMPWICGLSPLMKEKFKYFIEFIEVRDKFKIGDFISVLKEIKDEKSGLPLDDHELTVVLNVAKDLASFRKSKDSKPFTGINIYLPDVSCILREAKTLWLQPSASSISEDKVEGKFQCHKDISHEDGKVFGIATKEKEVLSQYTRSFGQSEKLTKRIRKLLQTTPFGIETFKELIQNADDAGATEVQIILDPRKLPCNDVFSEGWRKLQGPALSIYNNKPFTSEDLEGIQSLGEGSKEHELTKTGQYGVGFNTVYHLTDVPSILTTVDSERVLCVFDPNQKFVCDSNQTGIQFIDIEHLKLKFPDSFHGYLEETFSETGGSLMRLPLRTCPSDVWDATPRIEYVEGRLLHWKDEFSLQLLFVNNITKISVRKVNASNILEDIYWLQSEKLNLSNVPMHNFDDYLASYTKFATSIGNGSNILKNSTSAEISYKLSLKDDTGSVTDYVIVQNFGFKNVNNIPPNVARLQENRKLTVLPRGGVAFKLPSKDFELSNNAKSMKLFCSLPIPGELHLPIHVNGCFYLDHDSRRNLLNEETAGQRAGWNCYLMENVISEAFIKLLKEIKCLVHRGAISMEIYMKLFPDVPEINLYPESVLAKAFYRAIASSQLLPIQRISDTDPIVWLDTASGYFDTIIDQKANLQPLSNDQRGGNMLRFILHKTGMFLFEKEKNLFQNFCRSNVTIKENSPENILLFYKMKNEDIFQGCAGISSDYGMVSNLMVVSNILNYCKDCDNFKSLLYDTPLLVTQDGGVTRYHQTNKKYVTDFLSIVPHAQYQFVHKDIVRDLSLNPAKEDDKIFCSHLTIKGFESFLEALIGSDLFANSQSEKFVAMSLLADKLRPYKEQLSDKLKSAKKKPSDEAYHYTWLRRVWKFLEYEFHRLTVTEGTPKTNRGKFAKECVKYLRNWHIFPVCRQENDGSICEYLIPVSKCYRIMSQEYMKKHLVKLHSIVLKMGVPYILSETENHKGYNNNLISILTGMDSTSHSSRLLVGLLSTLELDHVSLTRTEQESILNYLELYLDEYKDIEQAKITIRRLPFYETLDGHLTSLKQEYSVFMLPRSSTIPKVDLKSCIAESSNSKMIVLRNEGYNEKLFEFLDCTILSESDLYLKFILNTFSSMQRDECLRHLEYIRDKLFGYGAGFETESKLKLKLRELQFIFDDSSGQQRKASYYYDPRVELFKSMKEICPFPPKPFYCAETGKGDDRWLDFLSICGLSCTVEDSHLLTFASHIERKLMDCTDTASQKKISNMSNTLLQHISTKSISDQCWNKLKRKKFIEADIVNEDINSNAIICLMDSYLYKDRELVFTIGNVLPNSLSELCNESQLQMLCRKAGIRKDPSEDDVVQNLIKVTSLRNTFRQENLESSFTPHQICVKTFQFLNSNLISTGNLKETNREILLNSPCISIDIEERIIFVRPDRVVLNAYRPFHPHLYILPNEYRAFERIMQWLNIQREATVDRYIYVLAKIKSKYSRAFLPLAESDDDGSDSKMVSDAVKGLLLALLKTTTGHIWEKNTFYLPGYLISQSSALSLYRSSKVIINDHKVEIDNTNSSRNRLHQYTRPLLHWKFDKDLNQETAEESIGLIPTQYRPKFLSSVIQERLISDDENRGSFGTLEKKFRSRQFHHAIVRLALHSDDTKKSQAELESVRKELTGLRDFKVLMCETVRTEYYDTFERQKPLKISESDADVPYFIKDTTVYLSRNVFDSVSRDVLNSKLAEVLNKVTKNRLSNVMHKIPPILNCEADKMEKCLDDMGVNKVDFDDEDDEFFEALDDIETEEISDHFGESSNQGLTSRSLLQQSRMVELYEEENETEEEDEEDYDPKPNVARVWLDRAENDLKSAETDLNGVIKYYEWSCYKCHQAAEKAIKAILLAIKGGDYTDHDLMDLVYKIPLSNDTYQSIIESLTPSARIINDRLSCAGGYSAVRYPSSRYAQDNHGKIGEKIANVVKLETEKIVDVAKNFVRGS